MPRILDKLMARLGYAKAAEERAVDLKTFHSATRDLSAATRTGLTVSPEDAMRLTAVFACVRLLSDSVASLPLHLYRRGPAGRERFEDHPLYDVLHCEANPTLSAHGLKQSIMVSLLLYGNFYAVINRNSLGQPVELWPLDPRGVAVNFQNGALTYQTTQVQPGLLSSHDVLHVRGMATASSWVGISPITQVREAVGLSLAAEEYGARFFSQDATPRVALEIPGVASPESKALLKAAYESETAGLANAHRPIVLDQGIKLTPLSISPEDAQFIETRRYQTQEIARLFGVPPHLIGEVSGSTSWGTGIEQQNLGYLQYALLPYLDRIEQAITTLLLSKAERKQAYPEFSLEGFLRGATASRFAAYSVARQGGWMSVNEIRQRENMNPIEGGDVYLSPLNMAPAERKAGQNEEGNKKGNADQQDPGEDRIDGGS